jgi:hypothetical protein
MIETCSRILYQLLPDPHSSLEITCLETPSEQCIVTDGIRLHSVVWHFVEQVDCVALLVVFREPRHQSRVGYSVGCYTTAMNGAEERHCTIDVSAGEKGMQDDIVGLEVKGEAASEGAVGKCGEERVRFGEPAGVDEYIEEGVVGADARVAAEERREEPECGERGVGHERAREGREDDESRRLGEER